MIKREEYPAPFFHSLITHLFFITHCPAYILNIDPYRTHSFVST